MKCTPENAEESFKCAQCGGVYARGREQIKKCPYCGFT